MLAIWICELSVLVQDSCGAKAVLGYFHCIWSRLGIIGQFLKEALYFFCSSLMTSIIIMTPFMRAVGAGGLATWQYGENTVCVINVVAQSFSSIPASMTHVEARPGWIDLRS